ncbi:hypothetical protein [Methanobrevibacter olleyae]|uniref:hypothetical protein n=1 Tax=Methanobrevibacter olleyae TaxID=294671 RepID=UPI00119C9A0E|nr:hypothetical protein [Methanobrevibacter olleyae]
MLTHNGKHGSKEISQWITSNDFGIRGGVTNMEVSMMITEHIRKDNGNNFMSCIKSVTEFPNSGRRMYYIE